MHAVADPPGPARARDLRRPGTGRRQGYRRWPTRRCARAATRPHPVRTTSWPGRTRCSAAARTDEHLASSRGLLDGTDDDRRAWPSTTSCAGRWCRRCRPAARVDADDIDAELERDPSAAGQRHAATARALQPTAEAKAEAWRLAVEDDTLPNAMQEAVIAGFAHPTAGRAARAVRRAVLRRGRATSGSGAPASWPRTSSSGCSRPGRRRSPRPTVAAADAFLAGDRRAAPRCAAWSARAGPTSRAPCRPARPTDAGGLKSSGRLPHVRRQVAAGRRPVAVRDVSCGSDVSGLRASGADQREPAASASMRRPVTIPPVRSPLAERRPHGQGGERTRAVRQALGRLRAGDDLQHALAGRHRDQHGFVGQPLEQRLGVRAGRRLSSPT